MSRVSKKRVTGITTFLLLAGICITSVWAGDTSISETTSIVGENPGAIPDNDVNGRSMIFPMGDLSDISNIEVEIDMDHTWVGDLDVTLRSPNGHEHIIFSDTGTPNGGSGDNSNLDGLYVFSDTRVPLQNWWAAAAAASGGDIIAPGVYRSTTPGGLGGASGLDTNITSSFARDYQSGDWVLNLADDFGGDLGTVDSARLKITERRGADSLFTQDANNGFKGIYFDITAKNRPVTIVRFGLNHNGTGTANVFYKEGSYVGFERNATPWTSLGTESYTGSTTNVLEPFQGDSVVIPAGETYGFFQHSTGSTRYTNKTGGNERHENADIITESSHATGDSAPFNGSGGGLLNRVFAGRIYYLVEGSSCFVGQATNGNTFHYCL